MSSSSLYEPTSGRIIVHSQVTVVSWPAKEGVEAWEDSLGVRGLVSYTCVRTGREDSDVASWFLPWERNMLRVMDLGMTSSMLFVVPNDSQLGPGQSLEWEWIRLNGLSETIRVHTLYDIQDESFWERA